MKMNKHIQHNLSLNCKSACNCFPNYTCKMNTQHYYSWKHPRKATVTALAAIR